MGCLAHCFLSWLRALRSLKWGSVKVGRRRQSHPFSHSLASGLHVLSPKAAWAEFTSGHLRHALLDCLMPRHVQGPPRREEESALPSDHSMLLISKDRTLNTLGCCSKFL